MASELETFASILASELETTAQLPRPDQGALFAVARAVRRTIKETTRPSADEINAVAQDVTNTLRGQLAAARDINRVYMNALLDIKHHANNVAPGEKEVSERLRDIAAKALDDAASLANSRGVVDYVPAGNPL